MNEQTMGYNDNKLHILSATTTCCMCTSGEQWCFNGKIVGKMYKYLLLTSRIKHETKLVYVMSLVTLCFHTQYY